MRWRVERAGHPGHYLHGWIASDGDLGAHFATWTEALQFALSRATAEPCS